MRFTDFRRTHFDDGAPANWWYGEHLLLKHSGRETRIVSSPQEFRFVISDQEEWQTEPAVELLGVTLARALGLELPRTSGGVGKIHRRGDGSL